MNCKPVLPFLIFPVLVLGVAGCSTSAAPPTVVPPTASAVQPVAANPTSVATDAPPADASVSSGQALARTDSQGAVEFVITSLNLASPGDTLEFEISMNTHSVDVSWDLAAQSTLATDTGVAVKGLSWPVGGGHHYGGILTFPAKTADGKPLLDGAKKLTLTIRDTDVPERVFEWDLSR